MNKKVFKYREQNTNQEVRKMEDVINEIKKFDEKIAQLEKLMTEKLKELLNKVNKKALTVELDDKRIVIVNNKEFFVRAEEQVRTDFTTYNRVIKYYISKYKRDASAILELADMFEQLVLAIKQKYQSLNEKTEECINKVSEIYV